MSKSDLTPTQFVSGMSHGALECRNVRHSWTIDIFRRVADTEATTEGLLKWDLAVSRRLECNRCGTVRMEYFARDEGQKFWTKIKNRYAYPEGYLWNGEDDPPSRWDYFDQLLRTS